MLAGIAFFIREIARTPQRTHSPDEERQVQERGIRNSDAGFILSLIDARTRAAKHKRRPKL
jgi:hypothetical protein